jgi:hypothetical protein
LDPSPCPEANLQSKDVLIALRGELLKQPPSYLAPLLGLVEDGTFQELKTLTREEFEKPAKTREVQATEIENEILTGTREGYGLTPSILQRGTRDPTHSMPFNRILPMLSTVSDGTRLPILSSLYGSSPTSLRIELMQSDARRKSKPSKNRIESGKRKKRKCK